MNGTALFVFFFLAILCAGLSVTNYLNLTILGNDNSLDGFKGNRSGFLDVENDKLVISTFEQYGDPIYKANALTVQDSPVKIQILNSNSKEHSIPSLNISNTGTSDVNINFKTNDPSGLVETGKIEVTSGDNNITDVGFSSSKYHLRFNNSGNMLATGMFNFAPYLDNVVTVPTPSDKWFRFAVTTNTTYLVPYSAYNNETNLQGNTNMWFSLPTDISVTPGDHINFVYTGIASVINSGNKRITKWGPPNVIREGSFVDNWGAGINYMDEIPSDVGPMGIKVNEERNSYLKGIFSFSELNQSDTNNTPAGTLIQFNALDTNPISWAVELDTVQPHCNFVFADPRHDFEGGLGSLYRAIQASKGEQETIQTLWNPGGTVDHHI